MSFPTPKTKEEEEEDEEEEAKKQNSGKWFTGWRYDR